MRILVKENDDLNVAFNTTCEGQLIVELPSACTFRQKVRIDRSDVLVTGNGSRIVWDDHNGMVPGFGTGASATLTIYGNNVTLENLIVENSFDYVGERAKNDQDIGRRQGLQAVALFTRPESTCTVVRDCTLLSYQDTLFADGAENLYENCRISGNIDFIFGRSHAIFKNCNITSVGSGYVTAPSTHIDREEGFVLEHCILDCLKSVEDGSVYLARPWHPSEMLGDINSYVRFKDCTLSGHISRDLWTSMHDGAGGMHYPEDNRFSIDDATLETLEA